MHDLRYRRYRWALGANLALAVALWLVMGPLSVSYPATLGEFGIATFSVVSAFFAIPMVCLVLGVRAATRREPQAWQIGFGVALFELALALSVASSEGFVGFWNGLVQSGPHLAAGFAVGAMLMLWLAVHSVWLGLATRGHAR